MWLYKHLHFDIWYNENQVIGINVTVANSQGTVSAVNVTDVEDAEVEYTYSVSWYMSYNIMPLLFSLC